jgi:Essential protein Yae1, N terminal
LKQGFNDKYGPPLLKMADDSLDDLLNLEENYYQEGYRLGEADGTHAGLVEGKLFGVEKGFEKAMDMGRLSGKAEVWRRRFTVMTAPLPHPAPMSSSSKSEISTEQMQTEHALDAWTALSVNGLPPLAANARLGKHIDSLLSATDSASLSTANSDEAVAEFDERLAKAKAKAKVISNIIGEALHGGDVVTQGHRSIEESGSLSARH